MLKRCLKNWQERYVLKQVKNLKTPAFESSKTVRKGVVFSGRVQKIGFRLEVFVLAQKLGLTGWVKNRADKSVQAELQGEVEKIAFLIAFMRGLKRAHVREVEENELPVKSGENGFLIVED